MTKVGGLELTGMFWNTEGDKRMEKMVSIIIPVYNRGNVIGRAIQSILRQTYVWYEIIVVDDGSTDNTEERVREISDDRIRYIRLEQNQGAAHARNEGIRRYLYKYIAFLDSDDEWMPDKLELEMNKMLRSPENVGLIYCRMRRGKEKESICPSYDWPEDVALEGNLFPLLLWRNIIGTPAILVKKVCLESIGEFNEALRCLEDWELVLRIARKWEIGFIDKVLVKIYKSPESVSANAGAFLLSRCYIAALYRQEMTQMGLRPVIEKEILEKARAYGLESETRELLKRDFFL